MTSLPLAHVFTCFLMFVYIRARFHFTLIGASQLSRRGPQGNWRRNSNSRDVIASSPSLSRPDARAPRRACSQATRSPSASRP